jgi:hypothetical protein
MKKIIFAIAAVMMMTSIGHAEGTQLNLQAKMDAQLLEEVNQSVAKQINELNSINTKLATDKENAALNADVAQTLQQARVAQQQVVNNKVQADTLNANLANKLREIRSQLPENQILGVNVNSNLSY